MTGPSRRLVFAALTVGALVVGIAVLWLVRGAGGKRFRGDTAGASVLLITVDTLRADRIGAYGNAEARTPIIDALAARGVRFENAITPAVMTLPSHASIMTGTLPPAHGIRDNGDYRLAPGALTLAEILRSRGMRTGAIAAAFVLDSMFGLDQGFEHYDDTMPPRAANEAFLAERPANHVTDAAVRFLNSVAGSRFFIWVHYFDPHQPYAAPAPTAALFPGRPYDAEVAWVDSEIGRLLGALDEAGAADRTLVAVVADHGEGLGDHGEDTHGVFLYEETSRVPLILSFPPWIPSGAVVKGAVSTIDLLPTILELVRIDPSQAAPGIQGRSLWEMIADDEGADPGRDVYIETMVPLMMYGWSPLTAVRDARYKYIDAPRPELYDLSTDPRETANLASSLTDVAAAYRAKLETLRQEAARAGGTDSAPAGLDPDARARLESLGYAAGGKGAPAGAQGPRADLPDPKDKVPMLARINKVYFHFGAGEHAAALQEARSILAEDPGNSSVRYYMAGALSRLGRWGEARDELTRLLERAPDDTEALANLAWCQANLEQFEQAKATYLRILEIFPAHVQAESGLANLAFVKGDYQEAARLYRQLLVRRPNHLPSLLTLAQIFEGAGRAKEAEVVYEQILHVDPDHVDTWLNLGWVQFQQGKHEEAVASLQKALEHDPNSPEIRAALGDVFLATKNFQGAAAAYENALRLNGALPQAHYGLGLVTLEGKRFDEAVKRLRTAVQLRPDRVEWREPLALALAGNGDTAGAARELEFLLAAGAVPADRVADVRRRISQYRGQGR